MFPNESQLPLTASLCVCVSRLGPSWRFYAKLIGLEVVGSVGRPVHSLFLSMPETSSQEIRHANGGDRPFILRLTTQSIERSVERIRIELESTEELVRIWMLANMMRFPNSGVRVRGNKYSMVVRDPDWHAIELHAKDVAHVSAEDDDMLTSGSYERESSVSALEGDALNGVLGGLFHACSRAGSGSATNGTARFLNRVVDRAGADWD